MTFASDATEACSTEISGIIFALVGPSGCGKSALIVEMLRRFPDELVLMRSLTTRPRRDAEDDRSTRFVSKAEFLAFQATGALIQSVEYAGNYYGDVRDDVDAIFSAGKHAIRPLIEEAVQSFRDKGYRVAFVRITPSGDCYRNRSVEREILDAGRALAAESLPCDFELFNRFGSGGFEVACGELQVFIRRTLDRESK
jgi:guanylate kinase